MLFLKTITDGLLLPKMSICEACGNRPPGAPGDGSSLRFRHHRKLTHNCDAPRGGGRGRAELPSGGDQAPNMHPRSWVSAGFPGPSSLLSVQTHTTIKPRPASPSSHPPLPPSCLPSPTPLRILTLPRAIQLLPQLLRPISPFLAKPSGWMHCGPQTFWPVCSTGAAVTPPLAPATPLSSSPPSPGTTPPSPALISLLVLLRTPLVPGVPSSAMSSHQICSSWVTASISRA